MTPSLVSGNAKHALLDRLIDDASLFPPASLPMAAALRAHARHAESAYAFVGGAFVCPASRIGELLATRAPAQPLRLIAILDAAGRDPGDLPRDLDALAALDAHAEIALDALDVRAASADLDDLRRLYDTLAGRRDASRALAGAAVLAIEFPYAAGWPVAPAAWARAVAQLTSDGLAVAAKVRCGGEAAGTTPGVEDLAAALVAAHEHGVAIRGTAGLHHPVRGVASGGTTMHGFLNVAIAALGLHAGVLPAARVAAVLAETDPRAFVVDPRHAGWREVVLDADAVAAGRSGAFTAFGSCSFEEPVDDLRRLGLLA